MRLDTQSYNNGGSTYNASAQETNIIHHAIHHRFGAPALCSIMLKDPDASMFKKYNVDDNDVYVGVGKVELEDPTGTDLFLGRILKVRHHVTEDKKRYTYLLCEDWLGQLDEDRINYDMREPLNDAGLRQSIISSDVDGTCEPVSQIFMYGKLRVAGAYTDYETEINDNTVDDTPLFSDGIAPGVNDAFYFGFDAEQDRVLINISTAGVGTWTLTWEYWDGGSWESLADIDDDTTGFTVAGINRVTWTVPGDWDTVAVDGDTYYWVKARISAYTSSTVRPRATQAWVSQTLNDDDIEDFTADEWNDKFLIFPSAAAGTVTTIMGPYASSMSSGEVTAGDFTDVWLDDVNFHDMTNAAGPTLVNYQCHINLPLGSLYVSGPSAGKIHLVCKASSDSATTTFFTVFIVTAAEAYLEVHQSLSVDSSSTQVRRLTFTIPEKHLAEALIESTGEIQIAVSAHAIGAADSFLDIYQILLELTYDAEGATTAHPISDTTTNTIVADANLTYQGLGIWERCPYSVAQPIHKHIDTDEGGTLISDGDVVNALTAAATIEHTTGISTRNYQEMTRLGILLDLGKIDNAMLWVTLGGVIVTRKATFNSGAPTALTDADVLSWGNCEYDYEPMRNEYHIYGIRIGDNQLYRNTADLATDPGADSKLKFVATRSEVVRNTGTLSQYETDSLGGSLVERDEDVLLFLEATLGGLDDTYRLGTEVSITSAYLGLTAAKYVVTGWDHDTGQHKTHISMHPRSSIGYQKHTIGSPLEETVSIADKARVDTFSPALSTQEW